MIYLIAILVGLAIGGLFGIQPSVNGGLGGAVAHPMQASLISFATGTGLLVVICLLMGKFPPRFVTPPSELPFWMWTGGLLGVVIVTGSLIFVPKIGSLSWFASVITGQILTSLALDHFGWLRNPQVTASPLRLTGAGLLLAGLAVIITAKSMENRPADQISNETSAEAVRIDPNRG